MPRITLSTIGTTSFEKLLGHNQGILTKWSELEESLFNGGTLDINLKEEVRRVLAFSNQCHY